MGIQLTVYEHLKTQHSLLALGLHQTSSSEIIKFNSFSQDGPKGYLSGWIRLG